MMEMVARLDEQLRQLKNQYDMFFAGNRPLPPVEDRRRFDRAIRELETIRIRDNATRFRFTNVMNKYTLYRELWSRQMREREEGPRDYRKRVAALQGEGAPNPAQRRASAGAAARRVTSSDGQSYIKLNGSGDAEELVALHQELSEARQKTGAGNISLEKFSTMIDTQVQGLKKKYGERDIGFRVDVENGKVKLKAKPLQED